MLERPYGSSDMGSFLCIPNEPVILHKRIAFNLE